MSALTPIILYKPTSTTRTTTISYAFLLLPSLKSLKIVSNPEFPSSRLLFSGEFVSRKPVLGCKRARNRSRPNTMTGSISSSGYRGSSSDEGVRVLQQDSSIHGSSEFPPNFTVVRLESTLNRLSKWIVTALFGAILLWRHDAGALWAAMGSVANVGLSTVLKQLLNQERPVSNLRSDPGMPSSHAQSIFFTFVFAVFSMVENLGINELTIALSVLTLAFGAYLSWLRVSQQLHTISQVAELNSFGGSITYETQVYTAVLCHFVFFSQSICHNISLCTSVYMSCVYRIMNINSSSTSYMVAAELKSLMQVVMIL
ncbi:hypothetical protein LOK49_LG04G01150 [Camellia lanceoleosa]|uniref:Uncharacterized protein n=1 Tax=Camellia lanceoleosa TaxID=1840588 RepID=A0ACC0I2E5_9ERIC|nr:hypothetical protein LOK49_LG04G01150 [Camellia lanceoleosa]